MSQTTTGRKQSPVTKEVKMPKVGEKAQKAWAEAKESWNMALNIEKEALKLAEVEAEKDYDVIKRKLRQAEELFKKRNDALKRHLRHLKREE